MLWHLINANLSMSEMSNKKALYNDLKRLEKKVKVSHMSGVRWVSSMRLFVLLLLLVESGQKRITRWLYDVICKQRKDQILVTERECVSTGRTMHCLSLRNNTWHAKLGVFWKQLDCLKLRKKVWSTLKRQINAKKTGGRRRVNLTLPVVFIKMYFSASRSEDTMIFSLQY